MKEEPVRLFERGSLLELEGSAESFLRNDADQLSPMLEHVLKDIVKTCRCKERLDPFFFQATEEQDAEVDVVIICSQRMTMSR